MNGLPSTRAHPRAPPNRVAGASAAVEIHARYVPGRPASVACAWQIASAPARPPRFAVYRVEVTKTMFGAVCSSVPPPAVPPPAELPPPVAPPAEPPEPPVPPPALVPPPLEPPVEPPLPPPVAPPPPPVPPVPGPLHATNSDVRIAALRSIRAA